MHVESLLRRRLHLLGIRLDGQVPLPGVGRVDSVVGGRVILEADDTLRLDDAMIVHDRPATLAAILPVLIRRGRATRP